jgi:hypothetical protein
VCGVWAARDCCNPLPLLLCGTEWRCQCTAGAAERGYAGRLAQSMAIWAACVLGRSASEEGGFVLMRCCEAGCSADGGPAVADAEGRQPRAAICRWPYSAAAAFLLGRSDDSAGLRMLNRLRVVVGSRAGSHESSLLHRTR